MWYISFSAPKGILACATAAEENSESPFWEFQCPEGHIGVRHKLTDGQTPLTAFTFQCPEGHIGVRHSALGETGQISIISFQCPEGHIGVRHSL